MHAAHKILNIWCPNGTNFSEKAICIGTQNDRYIQAISGIDETDCYITDIEQSGALDAHYKKMFRGAL